MRYYNTLAGRRERAVKMLHSPLAPLLALAVARRSPALAAFGAGALLHQLMDRAGKVPYLRMRRAIEARSGGLCEACGAPQSSLALMEPRFLSDEGKEGKASFDPARWRLLCRPCNAARELSLKCGRSRCTLAAARRAPGRADWRGFVITFLARTLATCAGTPLDRYAGRRPLLRPSRRTARVGAGSPVPPVCIRFVTA